MKSTLTVITPNYNHGNYISKMIESVITQSRKPDEFIIIDDGSTDDSVAIIEKISHKNPWITFLKNDKNIGVVATAKKALNIAKGDYIYFLAADDMIYPGFFEKALEIAEKYPQAGVIIGQVASVNENGNILHIAKIPYWKKTNYVSPQIYIRDVFLGMPALFSLTSASILRRSCLMEFNAYPQILGSWADSFTNHVIAVKYGCCYLPQLCSAAWHHDGSYASRFTANPQNMADVLARASYLMRSKEFADRFSPEIVKKWENKFQKEWIIEALRRQHRQSLTILHSKGVGGKILALFLNILSFCWCRIPFLPYKKTMKAYKGDLSVFAS